MIGKNSFQPVANVSTILGPSPRGLVEENLHKFLLYLSLTDQLSSQNADQQPFTSQRKRPFQKNIGKISSMSLR